MEGAGLLIVIIPGFLVFFVALWTFIIWLIATLGWTKLTRERRAPQEPPADAVHLRGQTLTFGDGLFFPLNYSHIIKAWVHHSGLFLRPGFPFSAFHPMLHLRWDEFEGIEPGASLVWKRVKARVRGYSRPIVFYGKLAHAVMEQWSARRGPQTGIPPA